jgi:hypothetical protein
VTDHSENIRPLRHPVKANTVLHRRWVTRWAAELRTSNGGIACTVEDISRHGAKLRIGVAQVADENVSLVIGDFGPVAARLVWRVRDRAGVQFKSSQPWVLDLVMKAAKDNQWPPRGPQTRLWLIVLFQNRPVATARAVRRYRAVQGPPGADMLVQAIGEQGHARKTAGERVRSRLPASGV